MPAYSIALVPPTCGASTWGPECGKRATVEVRNTRNEHVGYRCARHGAELVRRLNAEGPPPSDRLL